MPLGTFFITGVFFEETEFCARIPEGDRNDEQSAAVQFMKDAPYLFGGAIYADLKKDGGSDLKGLMYDYYGASVLTDIVMREDYLSFTKTYRQPPLASVTYIFKREGDAWTGQYVVTNTGHIGPAKCLVTKVPFQLFIPPTKS